MANEYAELVDLKLALGISDDARNSLLTKALSAASRSIEDHCGRVFYMKDAVQRTFLPDARLADEIFLVDDLVVGDPFIVELGNNVDGWSDISDSLEMYPENATERGEPVTGLIREDGWIFGFRDRVRVTSAWGFPAVPDQVVQATLILAARLYRRKDTPEGVLGSAEWGTVRLSRTDPDVAELVSRYVLDGFA